MRAARLSICLALLACPTVLDAQKKVHFDFRGHQLGDTLWDELSSGHCVSESDRGQDRTCYLFDDHVGEVETDISLTFLDNKLVMVHLSYDSDDYEVMAAAFAEKYGAPHRTTHERVSTAMGAKYRNETLYWNTFSGELSVTRYGTDVTSGYASIVSPIGLRLLQQRRAEKTKKAKKDL